MDEELFHRAERELDRVITNARSREIVAAAEELVREHRAPAVVVEVAKLVQLRGALMTLANSVKDERASQVLAVAAGVLDAAAAEADGCSIDESRIGNGAHGSPWAQDEPCFTCALLRRHLTAQEGGEVQESAVEAARNGSVSLSDQGDVSMNLRKAGLLRTAVVLGLGITAVAGSNGVAPTKASYDLVVEPGSTKTANASFTTTGGVDTMNLNPVATGSPTTDWDRDPVDGNYYKRGSAGHQAFCFHAGGSSNPPPYTFQYKINGEESYHGGLYN